MASHELPYLRLPADQRNMGMSMRVERSTLDQVKKRFEFNKKKKEEEKKKYGGWCQVFVILKKRVLWYQLWDWKTLPKLRLNASVFIRAKEHSVETSARFSNLKVGIGELSFPFVQEPTEKQPLQVHHFDSQTPCAKIIQTPSRSSPPPSKNKQTNKQKKNTHMVSWVEQSLCVCLSVGIEASRLSGVYTYSMQTVNSFQICTWLMHQQSVAHSPSNHGSKKSVHSSSIMIWFVYTCTAYNRPYMVFFVLSNN